MTRKTREYFTAVIGLLLLVVGLYLAKNVVEPQGFMSPARSMAATYLASPSASA